MMESILNFRDAGESVIEFGKGDVGKIKTGLLFRSGEPDNATKQDLEKLLKFDIRTVVDLRSGSYKDHKPSSIMDHYPRSYYSVKKGDPDDNFAKAPRRTINVCFTGKKLQKKLISSAPFFIKMKIIFYSLFRQRLKAAKAMTQALAPKGLVGMYKNLLEACDGQIIKILEIVKDKSNLPILIHCKHGKDRTGVMIAIILSLCGVDDEIIVQDYAISQKHLVSVYPSMVKDMERIGLPENFAEVPPETMKGLLSYIRSTYGSTQEYLVKIGFDLESQKLVRKNLMERN